MVPHQDLVLLKVRCTRRAKTAPAGRSNSEVNMAPWVLVHDSKPVDSRLVQVLLQDGEMRQTHSPVLP
jgi:hypothetical protein